MKSKILIAILFFAASLQAQNYKFGRADMADLQKEKSSIDPEASAEILYEKADLRLEFSTTEGSFILTKEVEGRIKIYNKDQVSDEYLNVEVPLHSATGSVREKISGFSGVTYNLEGGKIEKIRVKNSDIFSDKKNQYWTVEKFAFPNVKNGSVLEYKYTITSPFYRDFGRWFFQYDIPVVHSEYKVLKPEFFILSEDMRGEVRGKLKKNQYPAHGFNFNNDIYEYTYDNVRPLKDEPFVMNSDNLRSSIRYEVMRFSYPGMLSEDYSTSWEQIGRDLMNHSKFGGELDGNRFLDETVGEIVRGIDSPAGKMQAIFNYVKMNYSWNGMRSYTAQNGLRSTFKDKSGNCADINLLLVSMLQKADINAAPVILSTVGNMMLNYSFPSLTSLDFVIASAEVGGQLFLMDATAKHSDINMLPLRDLNHRGFRVEAKRVVEVPLQNTSMSASRVTINAELSPDGQISGSFSETKNQYLAMVDNMRMSDDPKKFEKYYLQDYKFDVDDFRIDVNEEKGMVRYMFKFQDLNVAQNAGNKIIINPALFTKLSRNPFIQESRNYPLEFGTGLISSNVIKIKIPEGYKVESMPSSQQFVVENNVAGYAYVIEQTGDFITLTTTEEIAHSILPSSYYKPMKELMGQRFDSENQQIVLVKE